MFSVKRFYIEFVPRAQYTRRASREEGSSENIASHERSSGATKLDVIYSFRLVD